MKTLLLILSLLISPLMFVPQSWGQESKGPHGSPLRPKNHRPGHSTPPHSAKSSPHRSGGSSSKFNSPLGANKSGTKGKSSSDGPPPPPDPGADDNQLYGIEAEEGNNKPRFSEAQPEDITNENFPDVIDSFDYPNADITEVVKAISKLTGKNFILDTNVRGKITIIAPSQITVAEAYRAFLSALAVNSLTVVPSGKFLKIRQSRAAQRDSIETYAGAYFPNMDQLITRIIKLKYISAEQVQKQIRTLHSKDGEIAAYTPTNSLIISDYGSNIERIQNIINQLDVPGFEEQLAVIRIAYAKAKEIADLINQIINKEQKGGKTAPRFRRSTAKKTTTAGGGSESYSLVVADERTNSIIVVGNKAGISKIRGLVRKLDFKMRPEDEGGVYVYYVRHQEAESIANVMNGIASDAKSKQQGAGGAVSRPRIPSPVRPRPGDTQSIGGGGNVFGGEVKVTADKITNSLIITASAQDYQVVKKLLEKIDIARDQVFIKTVIMEMNAQKSTNWNINYYQFNADSKGIGRVGFRSKSINQLIDPSTDAGAVFGFGSGETFELSIGGASVPVPTLAVLLNLLKQTNNANILSTPQLTALDNEDAEIEVGQTIPVGKSQSTTGSTVTDSTQREDATIKLKVTPYISPDTDSVRLKIDQQVKQASSEQVRASELANSSVVVNKRALKTVITVNSGDTAVLGGLMTDEESEVVTKVPILGDIPILGWLFKAKEIEKTKRNLMIFITPKIIRNQKDSSQLLSEKLNERIDFIQRAMGGRDPHGSTVDALPRGAKRRRSRPGISPTQPFEVEDEFSEEPAAETF